MPAPSALSRNGGGRPTDEFRLIARILQVFRDHGALEDPRIQVPPGDDAAVLGCESGRVVATTDSLVEGTHFRFGWASPADIGYKAVVVNLSDLAAMGARPSGLLISLFIPDRVTDRVVLHVIRGMAEACREFGAPVIGGNIARADGPFAVTVTALGEPAAGRILTRAGARAGDRIYVTGVLGAAALGLRILSHHPRLRNRFLGLIRAFRRPSPRLLEGAALAGLPGVHGVTDISDGLLADLGHVLECSGTAADVHLDRLPLHAEAARAARVLGVDPIEMALSGGEDYELIVCAAEDTAPELEASGLKPIGTLCARTRPRVRLHASGRRVAIPRVRGFRHR